MYYGLTLDAGNHSAGNAYSLLNFSPWPTDTVEQVRDVAAGEAGVDPNYTTIWIFTGDEALVPVSLAIIPHNNYIFALANA